MTSSPELKNLRKSEEIGFVNDRLKEFQARFNLSSPQERKKSLLHLIDTQIKIVEKPGIDRYYVGRLNDLKQRLEKAGAVEQSLEEFGKAELIEYIELLNQFIISNNSKTKMNRLQLLIIISLSVIWSLLYLSNHKLFPQDLVSLIVWLIVGLILTSTFLVLIFFSRYYISIFNEFYNYRIYFLEQKLSQKKKILLKLAVKILLDLPYYLLYGGIMIYVFPLWIIPLLSPLLFILVKKALLLDVASLLVTGSLIQSNIAAIVATYKFFEKKRKKRQRQISIN